MTLDTNTPDIYTLFSECIAHFDAVESGIRHQPAKVKQSLPSREDISKTRQDFYRWGVRYGATRHPTYTISLDYKFRDQDYTRSTILSQLGHLVEDLESFQKICDGASLRGGARYIFGRVENVVAELIRFLGHLPKELWLEPEK
ncbi:hypothetical protein DER46DRAFT_684201 [Fusarium sp. MPI-SDFR-AT-0072]|nr:hypothetical protein DER46DRAFT_684201 [Fusarium sp. MPI-SDFR-AT-0072]